MTPAESRTLLVLNTGCVHFIMGTRMKRMVAEPIRFIHLIRVFYSKNRTGTQQP
jgi:hypothetical protein